MAQTWSYIGKGPASTGANPTVQVPPGYAAGDILIIATTDVANTPSGWTAISGASTYSRAYYKVALASESAVSMTGGTSYSQTVMLCYRGLSAIDSNSSAVNTASATSISTNTLTTTSRDDLVISIYGSSNGAFGASFTVPSGTTSRFSSSASSSNYGFLIVDEDQSSSGTSTSRTSTISTPLNLGATSFAFLQKLPNNSNFFLMF
jgi:hypothetical protein